MSVNPAGPTTWASMEDRLAYIQRVAEERDAVIVKNNGTVVNSRAAINLIPGSGISFVMADNPTANQVDVTVTNSASAISSPVSVANGGSGRTSLTLNALLVGNGTSNVQLLGVGSNGQFLKVSGGVPTYGGIDGGTP